MRTKNLIFSVIALLFFSSMALAQVRGTVVDEFGPIPGVNILVVGSEESTVTDSDGNFTIMANVGDQLTIVNPLTLAEKNVAVTKLNLGKVGLNDAAIVLDEVVSVGYTNINENAFAGTADVIDDEAIQKKSVSNISQALAGESSGVRIVNTTGQPGSSADIRIRGIGSVNGNSDPLIILDGIPYDGALSSINPSEIANTVILKDATATAIYGSRGANGVIVINTNRGRNGKTEISYEAKTGFNLSIIPRYDVIKDPETYTELGWRGLRNLAILNGEANPNEWASNNLFDDQFGIAAIYNFWDVPGNEIIDPATGKVKQGLPRKYTPENWEKYAFKPGFRQEHNLKFSGGNDKTRFFTSFGYLNDVGYSINSDFERLSARLNLQHEVNSWLDANVNFGYAYSDLNNAGQSNDSGSVFWFVDNIPSVYPLFQREKDGSLSVDPYFGGNIFDYAFDAEHKRRFGSNTNAIGDATLNTRNTKRNDLNLSTSFDAKLWDGLTAQVKFGTQLFNNSRYYLNNPFYGRSAEAGGYIYRAESNSQTYNLLEMLNYNKSFGDHNVEALVAHENYYSNYSELNGSKNKLVLSYIPELDNAIVNSDYASYALKYTLESYFSQLNYNYARKYFLTATVRRDGSSRFAKNKWGTFGSVGLAWAIAKENFLVDVKSVNQLKLKASYGITGQQELSNTSTYGSNYEYYTGSTFYTSSNLNGQYSFSPLWLGNKDLTWETSRMLQVGIESRFFDRLRVNLDYYKKNTDNLFFQRRIPIHKGYAIINVNEGELLNQGYEFDVKVDVFNKKNFYVNVGFNGEIIKNKLLAMPIDPSTKQQKVLDVADLYGRAVGHSIYDFYIPQWAGVNSETGAAQWEMNYYDANGNNAYDDGEEVIKSLFEYQTENPDKIGSIASTLTEEYGKATLKYNGKSAIPNLRGAVNLSAGIYNFDLSVQVLYGIGGYSYDSAYANLMGNSEFGGNNWHTDMLNSWNAPGDQTDIPRLSNNYKADNRVNAASTRFLTKADYFAINNVRLGYTFNEKILTGTGLDMLSIFLAGDNLWLSSKRRGFNPTTSLDGLSSQYRYSPLSTITMGVNVKF